MRERAKLETEAKHEREAAKHERELSTREN